MTATAGGATMLHAEKVSLSFGGVHAVVEVDIDVHEREIYAIIGPNGAGKTSFFNALTGFFFPEAGRVSFLGEDITRKPNYERIARGMSRTFQTPSIFPELTVYENVALGVHSRMGIAGSLRGLGARKKETDVRVDELLGFVNLQRWKETQVASLSHGSQRLVEIAACLSVDPKLVLLDEPTAGLAEADTARVMEVVRDLRDRLGLTVVFVEHNMRFVSSLADTVMVMDRGRALLRGGPQEVLNDSRVREAYLGAEEETADV
ncbi:MAG TPA: ABC transporter ATP-binding protein [Candidatus Baltobacteraceae bacterium]|jgi:branched-chain amino acid transport system ATP-binding protein